MCPQKFLTDFDHKLFLQNNPDQPCIVETAPPSHQDKNGLLERNWQTNLCMEQGWLESALLPTSFWWFALKHTVEVSTYVPITIDNQLTTPFAMVYQQQPDLCSLFPMFSVGYITKIKDNTSQRLNMHSK